MALIPISLNTTLRNPTHFFSTPSHSRNYPHIQLPQSSDSSLSHLLNGGMTSRRLKMQAYENSEGQGEKGEVDNARGLKTRPKISLKILERG